MINKRFQAIIKELFIRCRKLSMSLVFITQSYFSVPKEVRLNSTHYLIMKIHSKRELQQIDLLDDKIKSNQAQYDLDREAAKISAPSSGELEKYEYFTGEDLCYKPDINQKAKFEYSPLGKVFNKGLNKSDKKEGLLKRLKSIEDKDEEQFKAIKEQGEKQLQILAKKDRSSR